MMHFEFLKILNSNVSIESACNCATVQFVKRENILKHFFKLIQRAKGEVCSF